MILGKNIQSPATKALGLSLIALAACNDPTTFVPTNTDKFTYYNQDLYRQADDVLQADYMFVLDYSFSMENQVTDLENSLSDFGTYLTAQNIDYRIGVVQGTTSSAGHTYQFIPSTLVGSFLDPTSDFQTGIQALLTNLAQANGPDARFLLEAARRTSNNSSLSFIRDSAQLVYVFVSDNDDISVGDPNLGNRTVADYVTALSVKSDPSYINARAWVLGMTDNCPSSIPNYFGTGDGINLAAAATALNTGTSSPVQCLMDTGGMSASLHDLARDVTRPTARFKVQSLPVVSTLTVTVNGTAQVLGTDWDYSATTNEVVFRSGHEPTASSTLEIDYTPLLQLSSSPSANSLVVTVDGNTIQQDNNLGWTFDASTNRILFNGSYKPAEGASIQVTYQSL